jgi:L-iditol 2-dehydrogenase
MKRLAKHAGRRNISLEDAPILEPGPGSVRIRTVRSMISRGSELWRRYIDDEALSPEIMGYLVGGFVDKLGEGVTNLQVGDRVWAAAPHAQYVVRSARSYTDGGGAIAAGDAATLGSAFGNTPLEVLKLPDDISFDQCLFYGNLFEAVGWVQMQDIQPEDTVLIIGQGHIGSLMMQVAKANGDGRIVVVDTLPNRCTLARQLGADLVIDASQMDTVTAVRAALGEDFSAECVYTLADPRPTPTV